MTDTKSQIQKFRDHHSVIFHYSNLVFSYISSQCNKLKKKEKHRDQKKRNKTIFSNMIVWQLSKNLQKTLRFNK